MGEQVQMFSLILCRKKNHYYFIFKGPILLDWVTHGKFELERWIKKIHCQAWGYWSLPPGLKIHMENHAICIYQCNEKLLKYIYRYSDNCRKYKVGAWPKGRF